MKSTEFIIEDADAVKRDCRPFLQQAHGLKVYRGINSGEHFLHKKARLGDRIPKDTSPRQHREFNHQFLTQFGENFRNGIFASGDDGIASNYGDVYSIYPIGEFKFLW